MVLNILSHGLKAEVFGNLTIKKISNYFGNTRLWFGSPIGLDSYNLGNNVFPVPIISPLDEIILRMGAPKSKITPARKKARHERFYPNKIQWETCKRCGEAKRSHRVCTANLNICAMKEEDWQKYLKEKKESSTNI